MKLPDFLPSIVRTEDVIYAVFWSGAFIGAIAMFAVLFLLMKRGTK